MAFQDLSTLETGRGPDVLSVTSEETSLNSYHNPIFTLGIFSGVDTQNVAA